ncbi:5' nucleotidase, NT5C type [Clostridium thailandense]|uniref:5' nucleotidase, NT5C type n=1 Tax=Clostridium thailandense TaxID=2794346 RepID=UPI00398987D6
MKNLNICIDIDGTITDPYFWLSIANKYFNKNITIDKVTEYEIDKVMGVTREEYYEFYNKSKFEMHNDEVRLRESAREVIEELIQTDNIYFVTARDKDLEMLTYSYLNKNRIPYDEVFILGTHYKVNTAKKLKCDIFIEDSYSNALQLSENGFKVLLIDTNKGNVEAIINDDIN